MSESAPVRIVGQSRRDLSEAKDEHEVEEELERRDPLLALGMLLAHDLGLLESLAIPKARIEAHPPFRRTLTADFDHS